MNIRDAKQEIIHTIMAYTAKDRFGAYAIPQGRQRPLLLIGPPGIGKTAIMEQAAAECGVGFVSYTMTHHTRQSAIGLPFISQCQFDGHEYSVTEYTMSEIIASVCRCMKESGKKEGLLFLDEINCVSETLAPVMLQFLQNKIFGNQRLPEGWILAAAGNPQEYNKSVREFDLATLDRLKYISVEADYEAWRPYALAAGIHGAILSYLDTHHDRFYVLQQTYAEKTFATARGWEDLSCILLRYEELKLPVTPELIGQYLHCEELAQDFSGYYRLYNSRQKALPVIAMLNGDEQAADVCRKLLSDSSFDEKLMLLHLCLSALDGYLEEYEAECSRLEEYQNALERLLRFQKQQSFPSLLQTVPAFMKKEEEILEIRREHGLSSEKELRNMRSMLYELRELTYKYQASHPDTFVSAPAAATFCNGRCTAGIPESYENNGYTDGIHTSHGNHGCTDGVHISCGNQECTDGMHTSCGNHGCTDGVHTSCGNQECTDGMHTSCGNQECTVDMHASYKNGTFPGSIRDFLEHTGLTRKAALTPKAEQLLVMTDRCISLFLEADGPEFTLLLSALSENAVFTRFFRKHPSALFTEQKERLKFQSREELLRQELSGM